MRVHAPVISASASSAYIHIRRTPTRVESTAKILAVPRWKMSVKLISIRYFSEREDSCSMPTPSFGLSPEHLTRDGSPNVTNTTNEQNARRFGIYSTFCDKFRALPWSYFVLSAIIVVVASAMSFSLLVFYTSREDETLVTYTYILILLIFKARIPIIMV